MYKYLLIHGAWHGSWCWDKVVQLLEEKGHLVETLDLPMYESNLEEEITLQMYADKVCQAIDASPEPIILVGHSMAGAVITQVAEYRPKRIKSLVYITGFLLQNNEAISTYADVDLKSLIPTSLVPHIDEGYGVIREELAKELFYGKCSEEDATISQSRLLKQPLAPLNTPVETTDGNFGSVPRYYVECLQDKAISIEYQKMMHTNLTCEKVFTLDTDHSPFLSMPKEVTAILDSVI